MIERPRPWGIAAACLLGCSAPPSASPLVCSFEEDPDIGVWGAPKDGPNTARIVTDWHADGAKSLRIDPGVLATIQDLLRNDLRGADGLSLRVNNTSATAALVKVELTDDHDTLYDRHQGAFGAAPGESTVFFDLSGDLHRGEEGRPYRGPTKTPLDLGKIRKIGFWNQGDAPVYVDAISLVSAPSQDVPGAWIFDFGPRGSRVMGHATGVFEDTLWRDGADFGFVGGGVSGLKKNMAYPTPLLGDGLAWGDASFRVNLPGGKTLGWIAFERGGFWSEEATGYARARLLADGRPVHEHAYSPSGQHFRFQDLEVTDMAQAPDRLVWPAHAVHRFSFEALPGDNTFALTVKDLRGAPLRVAGLAFAPDTAEGRALLEEHEARQRSAIRRAYFPADRSRRAAPRRAPEQALTVERAETGSFASPGDWPGAPSPETPIRAAPGTTVWGQWTVFARETTSIRVSLEGPSDEQGVSNRPVVRAWSGVYLPTRPYGTGLSWIALSHFRPVSPESEVTVGPGLARPLAVSVEVPRGAAPGETRFTLLVRSDKAEVKVPISTEVHPVALPAFPIPVGVFMNALPFGPEAMSEDAYWSLQETLIRWQAEAGLNAATGGPGLSYAVRKTESGYQFSGDGALRYLALAKRHHMDKAVVSYTGFLPSWKYEAPDPAGWEKSWPAFEAEHALPPHYIYAYDEPGTEDEIAKVVGILKPFHGSAARTMGFLADPKDEGRYSALLDVTAFPAVSGHTADQLTRWTRDGRKVFLYNRGLSRTSLGADLVHQIDLGAAGRVEWTGLYTQGFAFDDLDGREPSYGLFLVHETEGLFPTPRWLAAATGLFDARLILALRERLSPSDVALSMWPVAYPADPLVWTDVALDEARRVAFARLGRGP